MFVFIPHQLNDKIQRLAIGRQKAMDKRGARWAAPRDGGDKQQVKRLRTEEIVKEASRSVIDQPQPFFKVGMNKRKEKA